MHFSNEKNGIHSVKQDEMPDIRAFYHSTVLRLHVVRLSVRPSVCDVGGSGSHRLKILETNCTDIAQHLRSS